MRIPDEVADCSIQLYKSEANAQNGSPVGGSGFLLSIQNVNGQPHHIYAITNKHLINGGCGVIRLSKADGSGFDGIATMRDDWTFHPSSDLAVAPIRIEDTSKWSSVSIELLLSREQVDIFNIGYGDEIFMVGRLVSHPGKRKNANVMRFGNIALMADPDYPIKSDQASLQEGFLVECRSIQGFSGSPVFVTTTQDYRGAQAMRLEDYVSKVQPRMPGSLPVPTSGTFGPWLLGVNWGHIPHWEEVLEIDRDKGERYDTNYQTKSNSGFACVVPAWKILEVLKSAELKEQRWNEYNPQPPPASK